MLTPLRAACLAAAGFLALPASAHDHAALRGRLVFADHEKAVVRVLDLDKGEVTHEFPVPKANPGFAMTDGGRFLVVRTGDEAGTLRFLDTGLRYESHGDHIDVEKGDVRMLDIAILGDRPAHVISKNGAVALFYDGLRPWEGKSDPKAVFVDLKSLDAGKPVLDVWRSPAPQHGIAVPLGRGQVLLSQPNPVYAAGNDRSASSRPDGFVIADQRKGWRTIADLNDTAKPAASCRLYHGYAEAAGNHVFGCAEGDGGGMLVLNRQGNTWKARKLAYPDARRVSTLKSASGSPIVVGNYGSKSPYDALIRVDPAARALSLSDVQPVPGGQPACQFEVVPGGKRVANLTPDGQLRIWEMTPTWREVARFDAVAPFDCAFGAKTPTPALAIVGESVFVSDPLNGRIREYHLNTLKQGLDMPVGGMPANLAGSGDAG